MSGGMQQRLQIARCLAQEPAALMMDEPFGALDAMTRQSLQDEMLEIARATGATIFFVTHDLEEAIYLGDRVIGLLPHPGRIGIELKVDLPRPRDQVATRENPEFLRCAASSTTSSTRAERGARREGRARALAPAGAADRARRDRRAAGRTERFDRAADPQVARRFRRGARRRLAAARHARHAARALSAASRSAPASASSLGILLGSVRALDRLMELTIELLRPIPSVAVIPVALVALGFGYRLEIAIVAFACLWPLLILTRAAVAGVEPRLIEVARALRLSPCARIVKIVAPAALPRIFVAFRLAAGISLIVAVTVEIAVNPLGLGYGVMTAGQALRPELMLAYLVWIGIVGYALNAGLVFAQSRLFGRAARVEAPR